MTQVKYFVDWNSHNKETGAWNYKQTKMYDDLDVAMKEFYRILSTYILYGDLDHCCAIVYDSYGNKRASRSWDLKVTEEEAMEMSEPEVIEEDEPRDE